MIGSLECKPRDRNRWEVCCRVPLQLFLERFDRESGFFSSLPRCYSYLPYLCFAGNKIKSRDYTSSTRGGESDRRTKASDKDKNLLLLVERLPRTKIIAGKVARRLTRRWNGSASMFLLLAPRFPVFVARRVVDKRTKGDASRGRRGNEHVKKRKLNTEDG